jgi:hypothetical protein
MKMSSPVGGDSPCRPRCGLVQWVIDWWGERWADAVLAVDTVPEPVLSRFETLNDRMVAGLEVGSGVLGR